MPVIYSLSDIFARRSTVVSVLMPPHCLAACRYIHHSYQLIKQRLGLLQVGRVKALGEPTIDRCQQVQASARLPCCCHRRLRLMAARNSSDFASWRRATSRARRNQVSASSCGVPGCRRSKTPWRRQTSASQKRSSRCSTRVWASASAWRASSGWPRWSATSASTVHKYGTSIVALVARQAAIPWRTWAIPASPWPCMASAHPRRLVPRAPHSGKPCSVESATAASACSCTAATSRRNCETMAAPHCTDARL